MATNTPIVMGGTILPYDLDTQGSPMIRIITLDAQGNPHNTTASPGVVTMAAGTASVQVLNTTANPGIMGLTGNLPHLMANGPRTVAVVTYADLPTSNTTFYFTAMQVMHRYARQRTFGFTSSLNEDVTLDSISPTDSFYNPEGANDYGDGTGTLAKLSNGTSATYDSQSHPSLSMAADSFQYALAITNVPTTGSVGVYLTELL